MHHAPRPTFATAQEDASVAIPSAQQRRERLYRHTVHRQPRRMPRQPETARCARQGRPGHPRHGLQYRSASTSGRAGSRMRQTWHRTFLRTDRFHPAVHRINDPQSGTSQHSLSCVLMSWAFSLNDRQDRDDDADFQHLTMTSKAASLPAMLLPATPSASGSIAHHSSASASARPALCRSLAEEDSHLPGDAFANLGSWPWGD